MTLCVSKTALRISLFGGGTDIADYYLTRGGLVVSTTIDKYVYIAVNRCVANHVKAIYSELELVDHADELIHDRIRNSLLLHNISTGVEVCSFTDVTTKGTGLGSSSTFTVGLLNALSHLKPEYETNRHDLAEDASLVEIDLCGDPIGRQDQYAAAYGGFNFMEFDDRGVRVTPIALPHSARERLQDNLLLVSTGFTRSAAMILKHQVDDIQAGGSTVEKLDKIKDTARLSLTYLERSQIDDFGALLDETWKVKRTLPGGVTNPFIDEMYEKAKRAGALGGKLLGAGDGGYLLVYVKGKERESVIRALAEYDFLSFKFTDNCTSCTRI